jgi:hypothetical protein
MLHNHHHVSLYVTGPAGVHIVSTELVDATKKAGSRGSSVSIVSEYGLDDRAIEVRSPPEANKFSPNLCVQTGLRPTQSPVQWLPGVLISGVKHGRGVALTTYPQSSTEVVNE